MKYKFEIYEIHKDEEVMVAAGESNNLEEMERECNHYAIQYSQDYPIKIKKNWSGSP